MLYEVMPEVAKEALEKVAELLGGRFAGAKRLGGIANESYMLLVEENGKISKYSVKFYVGRHATVKMKKELTAFRLLPKYGLPAPDIVAVDEGGLVGLPLVAWRWLSGKAAEDLIDRSPALARALGATLARIHRVPLHELDTKLFKVRKDFWAEEAEVIKALARVVGERELAGIASRVEHVKPDTLTFLHCDYNPGNIVVSGGKVYVIDFESACIGDPAYDVAYALTFLLSRKVKKRALEFAAEYFKMTGLAPKGLALKLAASAAKLYLLLKTPALAQVIRRRSGATYPLFKLFISWMMKEFGRIARGEVQL